MTRVSNTELAGDGSESQNAAAREARVTLRRLSPWMAAAIVIVSLVSAISIAEVTWLWRDAAWKPALLAITIVRHLIELLCIGYAIAFTYAAVRYVRMWRCVGQDSPCHRSAWVPAQQNESGPTAIIYLCCGDLEEEAVGSLSTLKYNGRLVYIIHDDSADPRENARVDALVDRLEREMGVRWRVIRRPIKGGGKPAATHWVLEQTAHEHECFLLLDNDSYVCDRDVLVKAMECFDDPGVAAVQFRNRCRVDPNDGSFAKTVSGAIDIFDAFATGLFVKLWKPFVGHNAVLRTKAVLEAGGFTPGMFADDLDLTVRMALRNEMPGRVEYRRDLAMEERHPSNYRSFSLRSKKWAHGCAQIIRAHLLSVLCAPRERMTFREKIGFLMFTGFYITQVLMLLYMLLVFIVLPMMIGPTWTAAWWALFLGTIVPASIFLPVIAYLLTEGRKLPFFRTLGSATVTYGSTDLWTFLGLTSGFRKAHCGWVPTNSVLNGNRPLLDWGHFAAGSAVLFVPLFYQPELLLFPLTWLFAAKFLFVPAVAVHYGAPGRFLATRRTFTMPQIDLVPSPVRPLLIILSIIAVLAFSAAAMSEESKPQIHADERQSLQNNRITVHPRSSAVPDHIRIQLRGSDILIDGEPTIIRGIHYGPWRPGTGPGRGFPYPSNDEVLPDLRMIRSTGANTVLIYDPPGRVLDLAHEQNLNVIYVFNVQWWRLAEGHAEDIADEIAQNVEFLHEKPAVIAWMIGNEIDAWVIDELEPNGIRAFFSSVRDSIREIDPYRPVTHGNWALNRMLDIDQDMDIVSYNVYPFYPTEVAVSGFGNFIRDHLLPLAGDRPFIISEFGLNTLEATQQQQAEVIRRCWYELLEAGANGGVVFAFADEWWKNYDNPIRPPDYWRRAPAPDDHLTHDPDPEEHYGIVTSYRVPKPAFEVVRKMFSSSDNSRPSNSTVITITQRQALLAIGSAAVFGIICIAIWLRLRGPAHPN